MKKVSLNQKMKTNNWKSLQKQNIPKTDMIRKGDKIIEALDPNSDELRIEYIITHIGSKVFSISNNNTVRTIKIEDLPTSNFWFE